MTLTPRRSFLAAFLALPAAVGSMFGLGKSSQVVAASGDSVVQPLWKPKWFIDVGCGCTVGLTTDDGCFVCLYESDGNWRPGTHIPRQVAEHIANHLATNKAE